MEVLVSIPCTYDIVAMVATSDQSCWLATSCELLLLFLLLLCLLLCPLVSAVPPQVTFGTGAERHSMKVQDMWPYWLDGHAPTTVKNSFDMSSMYLLTGMLALCYTFNCTVLQRILATRNNES